MLQNPLASQPAWGCKWHKRYREVGFDRLGNLPRSGRPTKVSRADMGRIRKNAHAGKLIWTGREMREYIQAEDGGKVRTSRYVRQIHAAELGLLPEGSRRKTCKKGT